MNEDHIPLLDRAVQEIARMRVPPSPGLTRLLGYDGPRQARWSSLQWTTRRRLVRRLASLTAAAVLAVVAALAIVSPRPSTVLAEAIAAAARHRIVRCHVETSAIIKTKWHADRDPEFVPARSSEVMYFDLTSPRFRIERKETTVNDCVRAYWVTVQDHAQGRTLVTSSIDLIVQENEAKDRNLANLIKEFERSGKAGKKARVFRTSGDGFVPFTNVKTDKTFLEILRSFQNRDDVIAANASLDGRKTIRYELKQEKGTSTLWVDVSTGLPMRIEQQLNAPKPDIKEWRWVYSDFEWDVRVDNIDELFSVVPPAGYVLQHSDTN